MDDVPWWLSSRTRRSPSTARSTKRCGSAPSRPPSFVQAEPHEGQPATEPTEVRLAFDRDALYIGVVCHDRDPARHRSSTTSARTSRPASRTRFEVILDTFADRRNGFVFVDQPGGRQVRHADRQRRARRQHELGRGVDGGDQARRQRLVRGTADSVQDAALRTRRRADLGRQFQPPDPPQERNRLLVAGAARLQPVSRRARRHADAGLPDASQGRNLRIKPWVAADSTRAVGGERVRQRVARRSRREIRRHAVADARRHRRSRTSRRPKPTSSRSTSRSSACSSRRSASSFSRTPACSTSATSRANRGSATRGSRRRKKRCCCSSRGASA